MGSEGKTSAFWDKMINEKFVANCLNISKMLKKGGTPVDQSQSGIQTVKPWKTHNFNARGREVVKFIILRGGRGYFSEPYHVYEMGLGVSTEAIRAKKWPIFQVSLGQWSVWCAPPLFCIFFSKKYTSSQFTYIKNHLYTTAGSSCGPILVEGTVLSTETVIFKIWMIWKSAQGVKKPLFFYTFASLTHICFQTDLDVLSGWFFVLGVG